MAGDDLYDPSSPPPSHFSGLCLINVLISGVFDGIIKHSLSISSSLFVHISTLFFWSRGYLTSYC